MQFHVDYDIELLKNPYSGSYFVFEGVNASGKTTQVEKLKNYFEKLGKEVIITSEPNEEDIVGKLVRSILRGEQKVPLKSLQYLYTAHRIITHETVIIPSLRKGKIVLSSRSFWSAVVYGVLDTGKVNYTKEDANLILVAQGILSMYHKTLMPDKTFYIDVPVDVVLERMHKMQNVADIYEKKKKLEQIILGYHWLLNQFSKEFVVIDGTRNVNQITENIVENIDLELKR